MPHPPRWITALLLVGCSGDDPFKDRSTSADTGTGDVEDTAPPGLQLDGQWAGSCEPQLGASSTTTLDRMLLDLDLIDDDGVVSGIGSAEFVYLYSSSTTSYPIPILVDGSFDGTSVALDVTLDVTSTSPEWVFALQLSDAGLSGSLTVEGSSRWSCDLDRL